MGSWVYPPASGFTISLWPSLEPADMFQEQSATLNPHLCLDHLCVCSLVYYLSPRLEQKLHVDGTWSVLFTAILHVWSSALHIVGFSSMQAEGINWPWRKPHQIKNEWMSWHWISEIKINYFSLHKENYLYCQLRPLHICLNTAPRNRAMWVLREFCLPRFLCKLEVQLLF